MTTTPNTPPRLAVTLKLTGLDDGLARFATYVRAEPVDGGAEGFGVEGAVLVSRSISRDAWEGLDCPIVLPITLHVVQVESVTP